MISDVSPGPCCWFYVALAFEPYLAPVPPIVQDAVGCDGDAVERFFEPELWAKQWGLPLWISFGTAAEWRTAAEWWREARAKREELAGRDRFLSLDEINAGWDGGKA
jgi:hypothetical protein